MAAAYAVLRAVRTKLLIIDEFQVLEFGSFCNRRAVKNIVKSIGEDCGCDGAPFATCESTSVITGEPIMGKENRN